MLTRSLVALALVVPGLASAQEAPPLLPPGAELTIGLDARTLYGDATFDSLMDLVEASRSYLDHVATLAAWGFDPRADVHEVVFAVDRLGAPDAEFVFVVTGDVGDDELRARVAEQPTLQLEHGEHGAVWRDARGTSYALRDQVGVAGVGAMFDHVMRAVAAGATMETVDGVATIWMRVVPGDRVRADHPALADLDDLYVAVEVDATPALRMRANMRSPEAAEAGATEIRRLLTAASEVPEVSAVGIAPLIRDAVVRVEGNHVAFDSEMTTAQWAGFSDTLEELVAEELR